MQNAHLSLAECWVVALISTIFFIYCPASLAQTVNDAAFCKVPAKDEPCSGSNLIPDGATIKINELPTVNRERIVYFWGSVNQEEERTKGVAIFFSRQGGCSSPGVKLPPGKLEEKSYFQSFLDYAQNGHWIGDLFAKLGLSAQLTVGIDVKAADVKLNLATVQGKSKNFNLYDYRYVCPGIFSAILLDSEGNPLGGSKLRQITVEQ